MAYTKVGPFTNLSTTPPVNAAFLNGVETALTQTATFAAPAPSGGDDTATIQALLLAAQSANGTLQLQPGTYKVNLATTNGYYQPIIRGAGMGLTFLQGTVNTSAVLRMKGISGASSGGYVSDLTITGTGGIGFEIADANGVHWDRIHFTGTLAEGIRFHNESTGGFAEYNSGSAIIDPGVVIPVRYHVTAGNGSFHGSGLTHGSLINTGTTSTSPVIQIDAGAFPYAAPMTAAIFPKTTGQVIFQNASGNSPASFFGNLDIEVQVAGPVTVADTNGNRVYYEGTLNGLAASNLRLGQFYLADKVYFLQGSVFVQLRPYQRSVTLAAGSVGPVTDVTAQNGSAFLVNVNIAAAGYLYTAQLMCWQSPTSPTGLVTALASSLVSNTSAAGAPTFSWANYGLTITNPNYSGSYTANIGVVPLGGNIGTDILGQY